MVHKEHLNTDTLIQWDITPKVSEVIIEEISKFKGTCWRRLIRNFQRRLDGISYAFIYDVLSFGLHYQALSSKYFYFALLKFSYNRE